ncbi:unnamed protein product [Trichobilharzia szidati]|nr:unnamed protein product [Trichobilharzia szidati]
MDDIDPYFSMQEEVYKNLQLTKTLYEDWKGGSGPEDTKILTRIRQTIKNIDWDLMDLQETVSAVESNPMKFRLSNKDISARRQFLSEAKSVIKAVKSNLPTSNMDGAIKNSNIDFTVHMAPPPPSTQQQQQEGVSSFLSPPSSLLSNGDVKMKEETTQRIPSNMTTTHSYKTSSNIYSSPANHDPLTQQKQLLYEQDNRLDQLGTTISNLKGMSQRIGDELSDQVVLLDDFSSEMISTESRLDSVTKRTARLLHLSTDRRQWCAIFSLLITLIIILILLAVL